MQLTSLFRRMITMPPAIRTRIYLQPSQYRMILLHIMNFILFLLSFFPLFRFMNAVNSHLAENKRLRQELHGKDHRADIANDIGTHRASSKCVRLGEEVFRTHKKCICIRILNLYCARSFGSLPHQNLISV